jgi:hypothetical protein
LSLFHRNDLNLPLSANHRNSQIVRVAIELQVDVRVADAEIGQSDPIDRFRELTARE